MLRGRRGDTNTGSQRQRFMPADFLHFTESFAAQPRPMPLRHQQAHIHTQPPQGRQVKMVVMGMSKQHRIDARQIAERAGRRDQPPQGRQGHGRAMICKNRINENRDSTALEQKRSMSQPHRPPAKERRHGNTRRIQRNPRRGRIRRIGQPRHFTDAQPEFPAQDLLHAMLRMRPRIGKLRMHDPVCCTARSETTRHFFRGAHAACPP